MPITKEQILADLDAFTEARDSAASAHVATSAAQANVLSVTTIEQGRIDAAVAQFDVATNQAKAEASDAEASEVRANEDEQSAFNTLVEHITEFKDEL